ncbi:MAG: FG-GAP repeat domain-containing protein, partial [Planctomycetota bacterium]
MSTTRRLLLCAALLAGVPAGAAAQTPTFTNETGTRLTFGATDGSERSFAVADYDQDGADDVLVGRRVGLNNNTGSPLGNLLFMNLGGVLTNQEAALAPALVAPRRTRDVVTADFNADGWPDAMVGDGPSDAPLLLLNQGAVAGVWQGLVSQPLLLPVGFTVDCWSLGVGDLTNDGDAYPDVFVGVRNGNDRMLVNLGPGPGGWLGFADESTRLGTNANTNAVRSVTIRDMNNDGDQDIVQGVTGTGLLRMLKNDGAGQFTTTPQNILQNATYNHGLGDLNDDGLLDIFCVNNGVDSYVLNNGPAAADGIGLGSFTNAPNPSGFGAAVRVADIDGNGSDDFLVADLDQEFPQDCARQLAFLFNSGSVPFLSNGYPTPQPWTPNGTSDVAVLDINGDGDLDLVIGHCAGTSVFMQDGSPNPPV